MAWRSSGATNDQMVDNLVRFGVITSPAVEDAFRRVDRRYFVPRQSQTRAHSDQPLREGNVHISAPHIYGSVLEALELPSNAPLSFLNIGSGTGYLSCLVAEILGPTSNHYGVEIHADVVEHAQRAMEEWKNSRTTGPTVVLPAMDIIHGNGLHIMSSGEAVAGLDRIYIGASVDRDNLPKLANLLKPGGILVGPVDDELVKVIRIGKSTPESRSSPPRSIRGQPPLLSTDFSHQVLSGVRFAPLLSHPRKAVVLVSRVWSPSVHACYPESFREATKEILLCSRAPMMQAPPPKIHTTARVNVASTLPRALWLEVLSYTRRDWFEKPRSEEDFLRSRLVEEQEAARRAHEARMDAEARLSMAERERDIYRVLALRWQRRLQAMMNERGEGAGSVGDEDLFAEVDQVAASAVFDGAVYDFLNVGGMGALIRRRPEQDSDGDESGDSDGDNDNGNDMEEEEEEEDDMSEASEVMIDAADSNESEAMSVSPVVSSSLAERSQARTVSISSERDV